MSVRVFGVLLAALLVACDGEKVGGLGATENVDGGTPHDAGEPDNLPSPLAETCNALDDDLDGVVDNGDVCRNACGADAVRAAAASLRLPREGDQTVAADAGVTPQLLAFSKIPEFCTTPTPSTDPLDVTIGCGEVVTHPGGTLSAHAIRIAPGGSLRIAADSRVEATSILICPNAMVQAQGGSSRDADGAPGSDLAVVADELLVLGKIFGGGGWTLAHDKHGGAGGHFAFDLRRLLLAGSIETDARPPKGAVFGEGAPMTLVVTDESFFSGTIRGAGSLTVTMPVCCHGG